MTDSVERALILSTAVYREHDLMISLLTEHQGLISCLAPAGRKSTKRFQAGLDRLYVTEVELSERLGRYVMKSSRPLGAFPGLRLDLGRSACGEVFCEILRGIAGDGIEASVLLKPSLAVLKLMEVTPDLASTLWGGVAWLMTLQGFMPQPMSCIRCRETSGQLWFSPQEPELFCAAHLPASHGGGKFISEPIHKALTNACAGDLRSYIDMGSRNAQQILTSHLFVKALLVGVLQFPLRSLEFFDLVSATD
jgi:DNA repair protein RecO